ncbi:MAG: hypothetical protein FJ098_11715, partial [Deltaproteobacteria bacterium]|nr:hypothetical protein [Deltaproteobacteria bacterium]
MARWSAAVLLAGLGWSGCFVFDDGDGGGGAGGGSGEAELESVTVPVVAAEGGVAELPDGTALEIPPGALAEDTEITLSRLGDEAMGPEGVLALVQLEPEGLVLQQPVTLTIPFDPAGVEDPGDLEVVVSSAATPPVDRGGETSHYEVIEDAVRSGDAFAVEVQHFSIFSVVYSPQLFVTPAIPGKYLRAGDILYTTTGAGAYTEGSVFPMHVGMFVRGADNDSVIESTLPTPGCTDKKGVQESKWSGDCGFWHLQQQHILVGIRRPSIKATVEDGEKAAAAARSYLGTGYGVVGLSTAVSGMTCVQLAEQAWEKAGFNISYTPDILLTPFNQMQNTTPVRAITVDVKDGEVQIPVVVAVKDGYLSNYQAAGKDRIQAELTLTADLSTPIDEGRAFLKEPFA